MARGNATAVVAISRRGAALGERIRDAIGADAAFHVERRFADLVKDASPFDLPARPLVGRLFDECGRLILMMPVGAAVRLLAAHIRDKHTDAAVVCVDDAGRFAVSLLSGHVGGADVLAAQVADAIGATAVITSASHALDTIAVDLLGSEFGWRIEASSAEVTRASAAVVNGEAVGLYQDAGENHWWSADKRLPQNLTVCESTEALGQFPNILLITDSTSVTGAVSSLTPNALVTYRPRTLVVGVGSKRGASLAELEALLHETFAANQLALGSIRCLATAELKRHEPAIELLAKRLDVPVKHFSASELNSSPGPSPASASYRLLGIVGVAEPAALLASGGDIIVPKVKSTSATLAIARAAQTANRDEPR